MQAFATAITNVINSLRPYYTIFAAFFILVQFWRLMSGSEESTMKAKKSAPMVVFGTVGAIFVLEIVETIFKGIAF